MSDPLFENMPRSTGILLHITSLPGPEGIGTLGAPSKIFIDFLKKAGQSWWQILPYGPTGYGNCPYLSFSSIAGNPLLIEISDLFEKGWLEEEDIIPDRLEHGKVNFPSVIRNKNLMLKKAFIGFLKKMDGQEKAMFEEFIAKSGTWLENFALFMAIKEDQKGKPWREWPMDIRLREAHSVSAASEDLQAEVEYQRFLQFVFFSQWQDMHKYAAEQGIRLISDIPLYVAGDSADVWANPELFCLDNNGLPALVSGVPPDYFSEDGQVWGSPVYDWEVHKDRNFDWWDRRIKYNLNFADLLRIDHFRGLESFYAIPAEEKTGKNGKWMKAPGRELLKHLYESIGSLPFIAEDLGDIDDDVIALRDEFGLPGMRITQFGFSEDPANDHAIHNHTRNSISYTGTHDNDTLASWLKTLDPKSRQLLHSYTGMSKDLHWQLIRLTHMSVSRISIIPMQDYLELGNEARMNLPGVADGNWDWRMPDSSINDDIACKIKRLCHSYGRC